jgi:hypothetical protein
VFHNIFKLAGHKKLKNIFADQKTLKNYFADGQSEILIDKLTAY